MNKYEITITETCTTAYVVEANSKEEAEELFNQWMDSHQEWVSHELMGNSYGWELSDAVKMKDWAIPDLTYEELIENE